MDDIPIPQLTDQELQEFIDIYEEEFDERLTLDQAREMATNLLMFYRILLRPLNQMLPPGRTDDSDLTAGSNP